MTLAVRSSRSASRGEASVNWPIALFVVLVLLISCYRVMLTRSGQLYWPDEFRYVHALHVLDEIRQGNISTALSWLFTIPSEGAAGAGEANVGARPTYVMLSTFPAAIQGVANILAGLGPDDPGFYRIPAIMNVFVTLAIAVLFYRILLTFVPGRWYSLLGTLVYTLLVNTNLYVRHLFPYDLALLFLLIALLLLLRERSNPAKLYIRAVTAGLLGGLAFTTYPGYDPFAVILAAAVFFNPVGSWRHVIVLAGSMIPVAVLWEAIARFGGLSLVELSVRLFGTLSAQQGSFEEGLIFLPVYLWDVEGWIGAMLLALLAGFAVAAFRGRCGRLEVGIIGAAGATYLAFGAAAVFFHRTVFYGRLVHMYLPFVVLAGTVWLYAHRESAVGRAAAVLTAGLSIVSFIPATASAFTIEFPRSIESRLAKESASVRVCRIPDGAQNSPPSSLARECDLVLENGRHFYPLPDVESAVPPTGFSLVAAWRHPLQFQAYWYEGYGIQERAWLRAHPMEIKLYRPRR